MNPSSPDNLLAQLEWRYATKAFDAGRSIPDDTWNAIEESLILTPSSFGLQPWHFVVIENKDLRAQLLPQSWNQKQVVDCSHFVVLAAKTDLGEKEIDTFLQRTIDVRGGDLDSLSMYRNIMIGFTAGMDSAALLHWAKLQTYIALGQLMASAAALGIDTCPMEGINPAEYDRLLGLPAKGLTTSVACALGYRSSDDKYAGAPKVRFEKSELLTRL